ncbi:MAG TPA: nitronate monooxygenase [Solirubrobacteraceae bacterium]|nr:nitronate monooxygenase [Solirubrobacteraceae bacterium]
MANLPSPIVLAPMAGGITTPELVAAVTEAGAFGFLAAGYRSPAQVAADIEAVRARTDRPFGLNIFAPPGEPAAGEGIAAYAASLAPEESRYGVAVGEPRHDDDHYQAKLSLAIDQRLAVVSFTFGCPSADTVAALHQAGVEVWVTVTDPDEAREAQAAGADALAVQGIEAGGHRGYFRELPDRQEYGLLALLRLLATSTELPLVGAGGVADGAAVAAVLCAGAVGAALGSAFMLTPEAGTSPAQRRLHAAAAPTRLTRAFTGREARGIVNRFIEEHDAQAPAGYPQLHHLTAPIRAAARARGDAEAINLWAGQAHQLALAIPAAELVRRLHDETRAALHAAAELVG